MSYQISHTELRIFQRCPRQWALTYHWQFQPDPAAVSPVSKAHLGERVHLALEAWYHHDLHPGRVLRWQYAQLCAERPDYERELEKERDLAVLMVEGFLEWITTEGIDVEFDVMSVERVLSVPVETRAGLVIFRGKLDQVVRRVADNALLIRDWKTVDSLARANSVIRDQQMRFYALLLSLLHRGSDQRVDGALYTMLRRVKRTIRSTPPYYGQVPISYNRHDLNSTYQRATEVAARILDTHAALDAGEPHHIVTYPNPTDFCDWGCPFRTVCTLFDDGSRAFDVMHNHFVVADPYAYYTHGRITEVVRALEAA